MGVYGPSHRTARVVLDRAAGAAGEEGVGALLVEPGGADGRAHVHGGGGAPDRGLGPRRERRGGRRADAFKPL
eukprot:CAMPEP_0113661574 /NCGR_PEP_ID=MMETSP0038_2-20120614/51_1 /TAXON_ID=2898 /ORGANISM="Cryptomonas paramecium" /LENGTH=72 /DNA_ID=CAMNT_0000576283 /DNA_START=1 /DNA_END=219 /DNA_ORIENTATION=- /assembly_acc=CAM_ASM_000170